MPVASRGCDEGNVLSRFSDILSSLPSGSDKTWCGTRLRPALIALTQRGLLPPMLRADHGGLGRTRVPFAELHRHDCGASFPAEESTLRIPTLWPL